MATPFFSEILDAVRLTAYSADDAIPDLAGCISVEQTHSAKVVWADNSLPHCELSVDGVWTDQTSTPLMIRTADCLPILCYSTAGIIGAIHAGRKGTQAGIFRNALELLFKKVGTDHKLYAFFGPAICSECYQIDRESDIHFDLIKENVAQLRSVCEPQQIAHWAMYKIDQFERCTKENPTWYSYRRAKENSEAVKMNYFSIEQKHP